jgi:VIT1/CCC1 family predicted Fe2+/Mn2+ transporter
MNITSFQKHETIALLSQHSIESTMRRHRIDHLGASRQYWRDMILGVNDGLVSTFLLVAGVAGGGMSSRDILLTAMAGALAGAVSMCAGEYVATKSQNQVIAGELALEKTHIDEALDEELAEMDDLVGLIGLQDETLKRQVKQYYRDNPQALWQLMKALEFGVLDSEERSPIRAGIMSCLLFLAGSLPSVVPFFWSADRPEIGLIAAAALTIAALLIVGCVKTWATRTDAATAAMENLIIAGCGGGLAYGVGTLVGLLL